MAESGAAVRGASQGASHPLTIITYHAISDLPGACAISPAAFRRQLDLIATEYPVVRLRDIGRILALPRARRRHVCITFDDAYADFDDEALPRLSERGLPATLFVPTAHVGRTNAWDIDTGFARRRLMSAAQLRSAHAGGLVDIGSHTRRHVRMALLSPTQMRAEAVGSRQKLEDMIGAPVTLFSYPYGQPGDYSRTTERVLEAAGYEAAVTTHWGTEQVPRRMFRLRRVWFDEHDDARIIRAKIEGAWNLRAWKESLGFMARVLRLRPRPAA